MNQSKSERTLTLNGLCSVPLPAADLLIDFDADTISNTHAPLALLIWQGLAYSGDIQNTIAMQPKQNRRKRK